MDDQHSRYERYEKQRKNTKLITILGIIGGLLAIVLIAIWILPFGDNQTQDSPNDSQTSEEEGASSGEENNEDESSNDSNSSTDQNEESQESTDTTTNEDEDQDSENEDESSNESETTQESDDPNVVEVIQKDWDPIGTEQEGNHVTTYNTESQDWKEMEEAIRYGSDLSSESSTIWHIGNGGSPQKAIGTIESNDGSEVYRVYIQWVEQEGWKPTKVEVLKENDKRQLYENNDENEQQDEEQDNEE